MYLESFHHRGLKYLSQEDFYCDIFQFNILLRLIIIPLFLLWITFPSLEMLCMITSISALCEAG